MIICKNCKFWKNNKIKNGYLLRDMLGFCSCEKFKLGYGYEPIDEDGVAVENDEGWGFCTGPKFGCIHGITD